MKKRVKYMFRKTAITSTCLGALMAAIYVVRTHKPLDESAQNALQFQLWQACETGNVSRIKKLVDAGADPNLYFGDNDEKLLDYHSHGNPRILRLLLPNWKPPDQRNAWPAIVSANFPPSTVEALLACGADIDARGSNGATALMGAVSYADLEEVKYLVKKGANCYARDDEGNSVLYWAQNLDGNDIHIYEKKKPILQYLKSIGLQTGVTP